MLKRTHSLWLALVLLAACRTIPPTPPVGDSSPAATSLLPSPTPPPKAAVDRIGVFSAETNAGPQLYVLVEGHLPDGCTALDTITTGSDLGSRWLWIEITTHYNAKPFCGSAPVPFRESVPLNVHGLPPDTYTVEVNGVTTQITLGAASPPLAAPPGTHRVEIPDASLALYLPDNTLPLGESEWRIGNARLGLRWTEISEAWTPDAMLPDDLEVSDRHVTDLGWAGAVVYDIRTFNPDSYQRHTVVPYRDRTAYDFYLIAEDEATLQATAEAYDRFVRTAAVIGAPGTGTGTIEGIIWEDVCLVTDGHPSAGCVTDGSGGYRADGQLRQDEPPLAGVHLTLRQGPCPGGDLLATAVTDAEGHYAFEALPTGSYCVTVDTTVPNAAILGKGRWTYPALDTGYATVTLRDVNARVYAYFGWDRQ